MKQHKPCYHMRRRNETDTLQEHGMKMLIKCGLPATHRLVNSDRISVTGLDYCEKHAGTLADYYNEKYGLDYFVEEK